ncbi:MAG: hypothetical protein GY697_04545 [Desulfobacterales bacterium]|nr:hypothetical protein [Desulfobacterales bacterium]
MKRLCILLMVACLIAGCSGLPELKPGLAGSLEITPEVCRIVFPQGKWQFTHAIEAASPGGGEKLLVGVTVVDSSQQIVDCALMTVEGFVLFQAHMGKTLRVERAVPPFDREGFAAGIMADVRLMFLEPPREHMQTGWSGEPSALGSQRVCRYTRKAGMTTDVRPGTGWQINRYTSRGNLTRTVTAEPAGGKAGFPGRLRLQAAGPAGYTLEMKLVDAVRVDN